MVHTTMDGVTRLMNEMCKHQNWIFLIVYIFFNRLLKKEYTESFFLNFLFPL